MAEKALENNVLHYKCPEQDALSILEQMDESSINQIPVVSGGGVIGLITRDNLIRLLRARSELGI